MYNIGNESEECTSCHLQLFGISALGADAVTLGFFEVAIVGEVGDGFARSVWELDREDLGTKGHMQLLW